MQKLRIKDMAKAYLSEMNRDFEGQIRLLNFKIADLEKKEKSLESENIELKKKILEVEKEFDFDKRDSDNCKLKARITDLQGNLKTKEDHVKTFQEKLKTLESKCIVLVSKRSSVESRNIKLLKQVSEFEKILVFQKVKFEREKIMFEKKNVEIFKGLLEKRKIVEKDFEGGREFFENEISKLIKKLSELSTEAMKEQNMKDGLHTKLDAIILEISKLADSVKELKNTNFKVNMLTRGFF